MEYSDVHSGEPALYWKALSHGDVVTGEAAIRTYPNGDPIIDILRGYKIFAVMIKPRSILELMAALWFVDAAKERGSTTIDLVLPFVPGSRQDRLNPRGDYLFTAKSVAKEINARGFHSVTILDPHSDVTPALIHRCQVKSSADCFQYGGYDGVISPDAGAEKRAGLVAKQLSVPVYHAWKSRNVHTGELTGFGCEPLSSTGRYIVVDDICDAGGTFVGLAKVIHDHGSGISLSLYVTHGLFTKGTSALLERYSNIYCTDSVDLDRPGVEVLHVCKKLFEAL